MSNVTTKPSFNVMLQTEGYKKMISSTIGDPERARRFVASIGSAVANNKELQECTSYTILSGALLGEALNLSPSPQLGHYYLVPFKKKKYNKETEEWEVVEINATFILGYKGYVQLAIRSGQYKDIDVIEVKEGEFLGRNNLTGKLEFNFCSNESERREKNTIGYLSYLDLLNGFHKSLFMTKEEMIDYADKYSPAFSKKNYELFVAGKIKKEDEYKCSSHWYQNFDDMAKKTMLRRLISKWGIMSIDMQNAFERDNTVASEDGKFYYPETDDSKMIESKIEEHNEQISTAPKQVDMNEL